MSAETVFMVLCVILSICLIITIATYESKQQEGNRKQIRKQMIFEWNHDEDYLGEGKCTIAVYCETLTKHFNIHSVCITHQNYQGDPLSAIIIVSPLQAT